MKIAGYETHPAAELFPLLNDSDLSALTESVKANGLRQPIVICDGKILDGRNRARACKAAGVPLRTVDFVGGNPWQYVWDLNAERRHLEPFQKAALAVKFATASEGWRTAQEKRRAEANRARSEKQRGVPKAEAKERRGSVEPARSEPRRQAQEIASQAKVSPATVKRALELQKKAPGAFEAVCRGELPGRQALSAAKREERLARLPQADAGPLPRGPFPLIYADPPWQYDNTGVEGAAAKEYPTMDLAAICALPVAQLATPDAVLFLWATAALFPEALQVLRAWNFTYKTHAVWVKDRAGTGFWQRGRHEDLILAIRGNPPAPAPANRPDSVLEAPRGRHSEKPAEAAERIERMFPTLAKVELFCRSPRKGWTAWGNEIAAARGAA